MIAPSLPLRAGILNSKSGATPPDSPNNRFPRGAGQTHANSPASTLPLWLDLDGRLGRGGSLAIDRSNHHPQALKTIPPDAESPGRCSLRPLESRPTLLVELILHCGDALAGRRPPEIEVRSADDDLGERKSRRGCRLWGGRWQIQVHPGVYGQGT